MPEPHTLLSISEAVEALRRFVVVCQPYEGLAAERTPDRPDPMLHTAVRLADVLELLKETNDG